MEHLALTLYWLFCFSGPALFDTSLWAHQQCIPQPPSASSSTTCSQTWVRITGYITLYFALILPFVCLFLTDVLAALTYQLDSKWRCFGTFLGVEYKTIDAIRIQNGDRPGDCMLDLLGRWTSNQAGTGTLPRTWETVVEAVHYCGEKRLAQDLIEKHGGHLPEEPSPS